MKFYTITLIFILVTSFAIPQEGIDPRNLSWQWETINPNSDSTVISSGSSVHLIASPKNGGSDFFEGSNFNGPRVFLKDNLDTGWIAELILNCAPYTSYQGAGVIIAEKGKIYSGQRICERAYYPIHSYPPYPHVIRAIGKYQQYPYSTAQFRLIKHGRSLLGYFYDYQNKSWDFNGKMQLSDLYSGIGAFTVRHPWDNQNNVYSTASLNFAFTPLIKKASCSSDDGLFFSNHNYTEITQLDPKTDTIVFLHGWLNNFSTATNSYRVSIDKYYGNRHFNFVGIYWPAADPTFSYALQNSDNIMLTNFIRKILEGIYQTYRINNSVNKKIHIVAHSLGARAFLNMLSFYCFENWENNGHVFLLAPAIKKEWFAQLESNQQDKICQCIQKIYVFHSNNDNTLNRVYPILTNESAMGGTDGAVIPEGMKNIENQNSGLNHSCYWGSELWDKIWQIID